MKKKMPLICTIIFLLGIFVWSGITIKANESNIKFSNLYGERSELENVQFNLAKTKGIRMEDLIINSREIKSETSFSESGFDSIYSGFDVLDDKNSPRTENLVIGANTGFLQKRQGEILRFAPKFGQSGHRVKSGQQKTPCSEEQGVYSGCSCQARTDDIVINSHALYRLS